MVISLDYDSTYTRDPDLWDSFIIAAKSRGHTVICVTNRPWAPGTTKQERVPSPEIPFICAGDKFKDEAARAAGHKVAIWIDDMPATISQIPVILS
jgi:hypothetical protein